MSPKQIWASPSKRWRIHIHIEIVPDPPDYMVLLLRYYLGDDRRRWEIDLSRYLLNRKSEIRNRLVEG